DAKAVFATYDLGAVGRVTNVEIQVQTDLEEFHEIGRRHPTSLHPGDIHITGKVGRAYINGALLFLLQGRGSSSTQIAEPYVQPAFNMGITLFDPAVPSSSAVVLVEGVKFQNWAFSMPEEDFVMENVTFKALAIRILDAEAPAGSTE